MLEAKLQAREACEKLMQLLTFPADDLFYYITQHLNLVAVQYLYHFRIAEFVSLQGKCTFQEVSSKAGVEPRPRKRAAHVPVLRAPSGKNGAVHGMYANDEPRRGVRYQAPGQWVRLESSREGACGRCRWQFRPLQKRRRS